MDTVTDPEPQSKSAASSDSQAETQSDLGIRHFEGNS